jgi:hypothetical protein
VEEVELPQHTSLGLNAHTIGTSLTAIPEMSGLTPRATSPAAISETKGLASQETPPAADPATSGPTS